MRGARSSVQPTRGPRSPSSGFAGAIALSAGLPEAQTTNFYLWCTTMTVGESSGYLGYLKSNFEDWGEISHGATFNYPPWSPPGRHQFDPWSAARRGLQFLTSPNRNATQPTVIWRPLS